MAKSAELQRATQMFLDFQEASRDADIVGARAAYEDMCARFELPEDARVQEVDAGGVPSLLVGAPGASDERTIVYFHGGGYSIGSAHGYRTFAYALSRAAGARVLVVDYRLAPEHPHPAAVEDGVAAYRWAVQQAGAAAAVVIAGDSAGGGLTIATLLVVKDAGDALPAGAVCLSPWVDLSFSGASYAKADQDPVITRERLTLIGGAYLGGADARTPLASPLFGDLAGLPAVLVFVGTAELLEDDSRELCRRIEEAGGTAELVVAEDMIHVYPVFWQFLPEAAEAVERIGGFVRSATAPAPA